jgi:hypothetical protein
MEELKKLDKKFEIKFDKLNDEMNSHEEKKNNCDNIVNKAKTASAITMKIVDLTSDMAAPSKTAATVAAVSGKIATKVKESSTVIVAGARAVASPLQITLASLGGVLVAVDIYLLCKDWTSKHPSIAYSEHIIENLNNNIKLFKEMINEENAKWY